MLFVLFMLRKLPWYLSEYEGIQIKIWKELMDVNHYYKIKTMNSSRLNESSINNSQKTFEINKKLTEIIKLNERLIDIYCKTRPQGQLREISELLRSMDSKLNKDNWE